MKRIEEKIKQIEKKDRTNRILYMTVVGLICAFMAYVFFSQRKIQEQEVIIDESQETINLTRQELVEKNKELEQTITKLENSMTPEGYWSNVQEIGTAKAFINYIAENDEKIKIEYRPEALEALKDKDLKGTTGWLYIGTASGDNMNDNLTSLVWRESGSEAQGVSVPQLYDIVQLKGAAGRYIYGSMSAAENSANKRATWNPGVKAFVLDRAHRGSAVFLKIKY